MQTHTLKAGIQLGMNPITLTPRALRQRHIRRPVTTCPKKQRHSGIAQGFGSGSGSGLQNRSCNQRCTHEPWLGDAGLGDSKWLEGGRDVANRTGVKPSRVQPFFRRRRLPVHTSVSLESKTPRIQSLRGRQPKSRSHLPKGIESWKILVLIVSCASPSFVRGRFV